MPAKRIRKANKSRGGWLLTRLSDTQAEIAAKVGVSKPAVSQFVSGVSTPRRETRERIEALYPSVPESSWSEPWPTVADLSGAPVAAPVVPEASSPRPANVDDLNQGVFAALQAELAVLNGPDGLADPKRVEKLTKLSRSLNEARRMSGETALDVSRIVNHPDFRRAGQTILAAVKPFGVDAVRAVAEALRGLEGAS
ncbi:MAG: LacI family DNA-binding transcriptional regulator [Labilithrix sp.]|nr:LacI family DNA-binding transcriptional regulator [Labilithrix sp.]